LRHPSKKTEGVELPWIKEKREKEKTRPGGFTEENAPKKLTSRAPWFLVEKRLPKKTRIKSKKLPSHEKIKGKSGRNVVQREEPEGKRAAKRLRVGGRTSRGAQVFAAKNKGKVKQVPRDKRRKLQSVGGRERREIQGRLKKGK